MQKIEINVYGFKELSDKSKTKALNNLRYINTDHVWWDFIYEDFISMCKTIGIEAYADKIYFRGFYSQGDGSAFDASVNVITLIEGITQEKWKEYAPSSGLSLNVPIVNSHVLRLLKKGIIDNPCSIKSASRGYYVKVENNYDFVYNNALNYDNINKELDSVTEWVGGIARILNRFLYNALRDAFEYCISDKAVEEAIETNEYLFTSDGKLATRLVSLAEETKD